MSTLEILFWVFISIVFYTYIGYGLLIWFIITIKDFFIKPKSPALPETLPEVTLFITAWNEQDIIDIKVENTHLLNYPKELLNVVWITDGSTDNTNELLSKHKDITLYFKPVRKGKCVAMNRGMQFINTPITIFTDANTMLNSDSILEMVRLFVNPLCGCVAGEKRIAKHHKDNAASGGEGFYWRYESKLKYLDSRLGDCTGAAGELFGIRTELFEPLEDDTLLDDLIISLRIKMKGYKICYTPLAYAQESASANISAERKRKVRILAGGLQTIWRMRILLNPFKYGLFSFQYISRRVLRWSMTPLLFFSLLPVNILLVLGDPTLLITYQVILCLQIIFYALSFIGYILQNRNLHYQLFFIPYYIFFMNFNIFKGVVYIFRNQGTGVWERAARASSVKN